MGIGAERAGWLCPNSLSFLEVSDLCSLWKPKAKQSTRAIENALKILGVERDRVTVDILTEGSRGILGLGAKKARIRAALRKALDIEKEGTEDISHRPEATISPEQIAAAGERGKTVLIEILKRMGMGASIAVKPGDVGGEIVLEIQGDSGGLLIGRRGQTLEALQYLLTRMVGERQGREGPQFIVDTENYRERRRKTLEDMALRMGEKAKRQRKAVSIDALSAADRRVIHLALQDDPWLTTKSLGRGAYRRLLIIPRGDRRNQEADKEPAPPRQQAREQK
jgi:spoIIIJ-associated protein